MMTRLFSTIVGEWRRWKASVKYVSKSSIDLHLISDRLTVTCDLDYDLLFVIWISVDLSIKGPVSKM